MPVFSILCTIIIGNVYVQSTETFCKFNFNGKGLLSSSICAEHLVCFCEGYPLTGITKEQNLFFDLLLLINIQNMQISIGPLTEHIFYLSLQERSAGVQDSERMQPWLKLRSLSNTWVWWVKRSKPLQHNLHFLRASDAFIVLYRPLIASWKNRQDIILMHHQCFQLLVIPWVFGLSFKRPLQGQGISASAWQVHTSEDLNSVCCTISKNEISLQWQLGCCI